MQNIVTTLQSEILKRKKTSKAAFVASFIHVWVCIKQAVLPIIVNSDFSGYHILCNKLPQKLVTSDAPKISDKKIAPKVSDKMKSDNHFIIYAHGFCHQEFIEDTGVKIRPSNGKAGIVTSVSGASTETAEGWTQLGQSSYVSTFGLSKWWFLWQLDLH